MEQYINLRKTLIYNNYKTIFVYLDTILNLYKYFPKNFKNINKFYNSWNYKFLHFHEPLDNQKLSIIGERYNNLLILSESLTFNKENIDLLNYIKLQQLKIYSEKIFLNCENNLNF